MYCVKCGVELQKGVDRCPLCGLRVYHPEVEESPDPRPYPRYTEGAETVSHGGLLFVLTVLFALPALVCIVMDLNMNGNIRWSGFVAFGLLWAYVVICLPLWFKRRSPTIFFPIAMAALIALALYVCLKTGGRWFLSFAFPVGGAVLLLGEAVIVLLRHTVGPHRHRALFILGGAAIAAGGLCMLIEFLLHVTFGLPMSWWCLYPLSALALIGLMLIVIGVCPPLRISLHKKFFI
jgi:cytochrome c oxidase subunit IV